MSFEEQISAFLDGALTPAEETELLHILSVSPEKRALFHSYLGVQSAMAVDARTAAVPAHLDQAVLGAAAAAFTTVQTAGGAAASSAGGAAAGVGAAGALGWWTASKIITAVVLGLSLFGAGYFLHDGLSRESASPDLPGSSSTQGEDAMRTQGGPAGDATGDRSATSGDQTGRDASSAGSTEGEERHAGAVPVSTEDASARIVYRNVYVTRTDTVYLPPQSPAAGTRVIERVDTLSVALMQNIAHERPVHIVAAPQRPFAVAQPGRFEVELQREHLTTYPYIDYAKIGADRNQQQFALAAGYLFDRHHAAGLVVGQKSFAMEYYRIQNDSLYLFQQQPELFYGGGFYRFSYPLWSGITPEFTLQLGGTDLGPIIGGRLAVQFMPFDRISVIVGANGTLLAYRYKDKMFTSHSLGLSYGLRYRF